MTNVPLDLSQVGHNNSKVPNRTSSQSSSNNLFNNLQRNHTASSILPIITFGSFSKFEDKLVRMATNNKSNISPNVLVESLTTQMQSRGQVSHRSTGPSTMSRSSLNYPLTVTRSVTAHRSTNPQLHDRSLYVFKPPMSSQRTLSTRTPNHSPLRSSRHQLQQQPISPRSSSQYDHFLAYLRRQSLARMRRKQEEEDGGSEGTAGTMVTLNMNRTLTSQQFQAPSHGSLSSSTADTLSAPMMSISAKRTGRPVSTYRPFARPTTTRLAQKLSPSIATDANHLLTTTLTSSLVITPANSIVDDASMSPVKIPYELHINDDKLSYSYISDDSGVKYHGQMLPSAV
ncbi:unnamed protein product [Adineta ricciae]|uniref:Uncharacterized protein n=1 Tax=Adineta ricciae TaxID=249248 RepID=A0A814PUL5_ADIRI|nr:unnamed protein product [Adineta ricciae]